MPCTADINPPRPVLLPSVFHYFLPRPAQTAAANPIHIFVRGSGHKPAAVCALVEQAHEFRQEDVGDPRVALEHKHVLVVRGKQL